MANLTIKDRAAPFLATFLAWLVPGAGHVYLGRYARGIILFVTIGATFWAGIAIGGVMTVDPRNERWWFIAQMLTGLHGLVAWQQQGAVYEDYLDELSSDKGFRDEYRATHDELRNAGSESRRRALLRNDAVRRRVYIDSYEARDGLALVAPADTVARAYAGVAGLLNVMCVFDALMLALMGKTGERNGGKRRRSAKPTRRTEEERKTDS